MTAKKGTPMPERTSVTISPTEGNSEAFSFGLIRFTAADACKTYVYTVTETGAVNRVTNDTAKIVTIEVTDNGDGTLSIDNSTSARAMVFVNTYNPPPVVPPTPTPTPEPSETPTPEPTAVSGSKTWVDDDDQDGLRPDSITIRLYANGTEVDSVRVTEESGWRWSFTDLASVTEDGRPIVYTISEDAVDHYTTSIQGYNVTNYHRSEVTSVTIHKVWDDEDNKYRMRPASIRATLSNGMTVTLSAANNWTATITDLPVYSNGEKISYTWTEHEVLGYRKKSIVLLGGNLTILTNTLRRTPGKPGEPYLIIEEYGTPLGVEVIINHVGDCFD